MNKVTLIFIFAIPLFFSACNGTKADDAITVGDEQDSMVWGNAPNKGPIEVNSVDTSEMFVLTDERGVYLVKERYNIKDDEEEEVWVVKKILARDSTSAI